MIGTSRTIIVVACVAALVVASCGSKDKSEGDADAEADAPDVTDVLTDLEPDGEPDAEEDPVPDGAPDAEPDGEADAEDAPADATGDADDDCVTSGAGSLPTTDLDACLKAASCVALPEMTGMGFLEFCLLQDVITTSPMYGEIIELFVISMYLSFLDEVADNTSCISAASDCDGVLACLNGGSSSASCATPDVDIPIMGTGCSGDVLSLCVNTEAGTTNGREVLHDCTDDGLSCVTMGTYGAGCMQTDCTAAGDPECRGPRAEVCLAAGVHIVIDCGDMAHGAGGRCGDADPSTTEVDVGCVPTGGTCDSTSAAPYCDGDDLVECDPFWDRWVGMDCSLIGADWTCNDSVDPPDCIPDRTSWTCTLTPVPACDCDDVVLCDITSGADLRVECPDYGFGTCGDTDPSTTELEAGCVD